ncbi:MAG: aminotransferase class I/II-fold pyridoxal phosphate-dependent enzyme [Planctomycetota bacterium]
MKQDEALPPFRREISRIMPYRVGNPPHQRKLNQNESALELPDHLREKILRRLRSRGWRRYPEYPAEELTRRIARAERLATTRVLVGHASNELMYAIALATLERGRSLLIPSPSYPVVELAATLAGGQIRRVPLGSGFQYDPDRIVAAIRRHSPRLVFLPSPNNPTGTALDRSAVESVARATRSLVVVDEAYREFSDVDLRPLLDRHPNLVLLRTLSKAYRIAALRVGYLLGSAPVLSRIERGKPPHSIDLLGQIAGEEIFENPAFIQEEVERVISERAWLTRELGQLPGARAFPSQANFVLVRLPNARRAFAALLKGGCLVRPVGLAANSPARLKNCLRISIGTRSDNRAVMRILTRRSKGGTR